MLKIQMLEQIVTNESVIEDQHQELNEERRLTQNGLSPQGLVPLFLFQLSQCLG